MSFLLDTNAVLRLGDPASKGHSELLRSFNRAIAEGLEPTLAAQVLYETWVVLTRPRENNGWNFAPSAAASFVRAAKQAYGFREDPEGLADHWLDLCVAHGVRGRQGHDARLVAWMELQGVRRLLTLNGGDFARYPQVEVVDLAV